MFQSAAWGPGVGTLLGWGRQPGFSEEQGVPGAHSVVNNSLQPPGL